MKKLLALSLILVMLLCSCSVSKNDDEEPDISQYIVEKDEKTYVILPISGRKVKIDSFAVQNKYFENIDVELLTAAEQKILKASKEYGDTPLFYLQFKAGNAFLCSELIEDLDPSDPDYGNVGCGDHRHVILTEPISKQ